MSCGNGQGFMNMSPLGSRPTPVQMFTILAARSSNRDQQWQSSPNPRTLPERAANQFGTPEKVGSHGMKHNASSMAEALGSRGCSPIANAKKCQLEGGQQSNSHWHHTKAKTMFQASGPKGSRPIQKAQKALLCNQISF